MLSTWIYTICMVLFLLYTLVKKKSPLGIFLVAYYTFIAILTIVGGKVGAIETNRTTLIPYLFLVFAYILFFFPFIQSRKMLDSQKVTVIEENKYKLFSYGYILASTVTSICYIGPVSKLIASRNWAIQRDMLYGKYEQEIVYPYSNTFEYLCMLVTIYFFLLAMIIAFVMIKNKENAKLGFILLVTTSLANVLSSLFTSSRGNIFNLVILILALYVFLMGNAAEKDKRFIVLIGCIGLIGVMPYVVEITFSRFDTAATSEVIRYFGEAPAVFNFGVATADKCAWGRYCFSELLNTNYSQSDIGASYGARFFTFVGYLFIDWGYIGVVIIGIICVALCYSIIIKPKYRISDLFLIMYYYQTLLKGGLVIGRTYLKGTLVTIVIYLFLRYGVEKMNLTLPKFRIGRIKLYK